MTPITSHWTERSIVDFQYRIGTDFVLQLSKKMEAPPQTNRKELAEILGVSAGRVSQVFNNPGNLSLGSIIKYARALGMKVAVVAYDDGDPSNERGPVNSEIFQRCWSRCGSPKDFFDLDEQTEGREQSNTLTSSQRILPAAIPVIEYRTDKCGTVGTIFDGLYNVNQMANTPQFIQTGGR